MARDRDPLRADGWAGSGGTEPYGGSDALAGGFSGSDSLAVGTAPDALRLPSLGDTLAVPTLGDALSAGPSYAAEAFELPPLPIPPAGSDAAPPPPAAPPPAAARPRGPVRPRTGAPAQPATSRAGGAARPGISRAGGPTRRGGAQPGRPASPTGGSGTGPQRSGPTWADLQQMAPPSPQPKPRPAALPNRTTRPTGTVPWAPNSGWDFTDSTGRRIPVPQSPVELGRFLLDAFRKNLNGPR